MSFLKKIGVAFILLVTTFPVIRPGISLQIDPQIHWVFNYLWQLDFGETQNLIFPHGPLTFINFPLAMGDNLFWGVLIQTILRLCFIYTFLHLSSWTNAQKWWLHAVIAFFLLEFMELDFIIAATVANLLFLHYYTQKNSWFFLSLFFATLGFYIKMSIGIVSFSMIVPFLGFLFFEKKQNETFPKVALEFGWKMLFVPFSLALGWFLMYQNLDGLGTYFYGALELVKGNSDSASLYPDNNWWLLGVSFLSFLLIPFLGKSRMINLVYIVLGFSVFAVWKHGMAREDPWHIIKVFAWLMVFFTYVFILNNKEKKTTDGTKNNFKFSNQVAIFGLPFFTLLFFYGNIKYTLNQFVDELGTDGYKNFISATIQQKDLFQKNKKESIERIQPCKMSFDDLQLIDNQVVDCYPWSYAFVAANGLNWQPRPVFQSYAAYTPWLDAQNSNHFLSPKAPQFLIWENDILKRDLWESDLVSIDNRYVLNDEPQTIATIFSNYKLVNKEDNYLLFEKNKTTLLQKPKIKSSIKSTWNKWVTVPYFGDGILRAKLKIEGTFLKWLKAKMYKDEPLFIEYQLENGEIHKHRFSAENAAQGLWINPFIIRPSSDVINPTTAKIRFSCGNDFFVKKEITIDWQFFSTKKTRENGKYNNAFSLFGKTIQKKETVILEKEDLLKEALLLSSRGFSPAYEINLEGRLKDSISNYLITASVESKMSYHGKALLIIVLEKEKEVILWESKSVENFMTVYHQWELAFLKRKIPSVSMENVVLKVYVWNTAEEDIFIKNLKMKITESK